MKRGEVWLVTLDPTIGSEIRKTRPGLIISPDEMNDHLRTVAIAPLTSGSHPAPFRVPTSFDDKQGLLLTDQMRTVDKTRLVKRLGTIDGRTLRTTLAVMRDMFEE